MTVKLSDARVLYEKGFAILWLYPKSKRPIGVGWTKGPRKTWDVLKKEYYETVNMGVRTGTPSKLKNGYLCVIDVDIKSASARHRKEAVCAALKLVGGKKLPCVMSGRGNGSRHYYCVTSTTFKTYDPASSDEEIKVYMPSKMASDYERKKLTAEEIEQGIRLSPAWGVSVYSDGRQCVLPPSLHPDSGRRYEWKRTIERTLPHVDIAYTVSEKLPGNGSAYVVSDKEKNDFKFTPKIVELSWLPLSDKIRDGITTGAGVSDRSAFLLPAARALLAADLSRDEILSVLTDKTTYLGKCAYDHAKTTDQSRAALWVYRYSVRKITEEQTGTGIFRPALEYANEVPLTKAERRKQDQKLKAEKNWQDELIRGGQKGDGAPKSIMSNIRLILENEVSPSFVARDEFALRDSYLEDVPWGSSAGEILDDDEILKIMHWLEKRWRFEVRKESVHNAVTVMACANSYSPIRDYLDALPEWDRVNRLNTWLAKNFGAKGHREYLAQVFRKWMVAMVMRAYDPGAKFDWMPIFEGNQGVGKSSFGRILVGDKHFIDWLPNLADKDAALNLQGVWCCEMGELSQFRRNELETIKAFITRTVDKMRPPFGRRTIESPRRCVFFGTTNKDAYLRDDTGNRRFKPLEVGTLRFKVLERERVQLFAEAKYLYENFLENDRTMELTGEAKRYELEIQKEKMILDDSDVMVEQIGAFIDENKTRENDAKFPFFKFQICDVFSGTGCLQKWRLDNRNVQFAAKALKKLGAQSWKSHGTKYWKLENGDRLE